MQTNTKSNMATVAKTQTKRKKRPIISRENRRKVARAYYQMYSAFVLQGLLAGKTLGASSHNAILLIRAKLATMDKNNPVTKYLLRISSRHAKRIAKRIMTSKYRDAHAISTPDVRAKISAQIPKLVNSSLKTFVTISARYQTREKVATTKSAPKPTPVATKPTIRISTAVQKQHQLLQVWLQQEIQRQHTYSRNS